jgi:hypothetical protein
MTSPDHHAAVLALEPLQRDRTLAYAESLVNTAAQQSDQLNDGGVQNSLAPGTDVCSEMILFATLATCNIQTPHGRYTVVRGKSRGKSG